MRTIVKTTVLAAMLAVAACYSSDYPHAIATNASLLADLSDKLSDYCRAGFKMDDRSVSSEEMGEFYYALNKASAFSSSTPREASLHSHKDFDKLIVAYEKYVHEADGYRIKGAPDPVAIAALDAQHEIVRHLAGRVASDLKNEKR